MSLAHEALKRLQLGNEAFQRGESKPVDLSSDRIHELFHEGQHPFATVICCSDSRVAPEHIFGVGLGEIFVIRVAGNVIDSVVEASALYGCEHLGTPLLLVMGHTGCGAIAAALEEEALESPLPDQALDEAFHEAFEEAGTESLEKSEVNHLASLLSPIIEAIGHTCDPHEASILNVRSGIARLKAHPALAHLCEDFLEIRGALYHADSGRVEILPE